jgi:hypothetical protein
LRDRFGYSWALASFEIVVIVLLSAALLLGHEKKGKNFMASQDPVAPGQTYESRLNEEESDLHLNPGNSRLQSSKS